MFQRMTTNDPSVTTAESSPSERLSVPEVKFRRSSEIRWSGLSVPRFSSSRR